MTYLDIQSRICTVLTEAGIAGGSVYVADEPLDIETLPAVMVTQTYLQGRPDAGWYDATIVVSCIARSEQTAGVLADAVLTLLDGYGGCGIADITHTGTYPQRTAETAPVTHNYVLTFRVLYQNLKKKCQINT